MASLRDRKGKGCLSSPTAQCTLSVISQYLEKTRKQLEIMEMLFITHSIITRQTVCYDAVAVRSAVLATDFLLADFLTVCTCVTVASVSLSSVT